MSVIKLNVEVAFYYIHDDPISAHCYKIFHALLSMLFNLLDWHEDVIIYCCKKFYRRGPVKTICITSQVHKFPDILQK
jgi:hypothetical protein